jgi:hypothetical protein
MKITSAFLCLLVAAGIVSAQPSGITAPSTKTGTVDGVVTNAITGEPVRKAVVTLRGVSQTFAYQAVSDAAGHFHFDKVDPGSYNATAARDGFAIQTPGRHEKPITVSEDQNVTDVAVPLKPLASVGGHVLDDEGDPIILANVQAIRTTYNEGRKRLNQVAAVRSNDLGEFQFVNLDAGRYYFRVSAQPRPASLPPRTRMSRIEQAYPPTYYPTAADLGQATTVNVALGTEVNGIDFRLRRTPAYHIRGKVVDGLTGQPASNIAVQLAPDEAEFVPGGETAVAVQPDGAFDLHAIVNGSYMVSAENFQSGATMFARQPVQVDDQDVTVVLTLSSGFDVFGRAAVEGPAPAQMNAQVLLNSERPHNGSVPQAEIAQDGTFELSHVTPDTYRIAVLPSAPGLYVKSIRFGDQDVTDGRIRLSQPGGALNILFGTDGGQIQGSVESASGEALPNAPVTLAPTGQHENRADLVKVAGADQYGHFSFQDLAPGDYQVFAWGDQEVDFGLIQNADFRKLLSGQAASVSVGSNGSESVQLRLISAEDIEQAMSKLP